MTKREKKVIDVIFMPLEGLAWLLGQLFALPYRLMLALMKHFEK